MQSRKTYFGETPQQYRPACCVELLQRRDRLTRIAQIAIRVVLDDRNAGGACSFEHFMARGKRQSRAGRILEIRRHYEEARALAQDAAELRNVQPVPSHGS